MVLQTVQMLDSKNIRLTNVGPVQTADQYKHWTGKNIRAVQTSDLYFFNYQEKIQRFFKNPQLYCQISEISQNNEDGKAGGQQYPGQERRAS